jgi:hypothetical protein
VFSQIAGHWMNGTLVSHHIVGWTLILVAGAIITAAFWFDPPADYPNWPKATVVQARWWSAAVQGGTVAIVAGLIAYVIYFRPDVVGKRHQWQEYNDHAQVAQTEGNAVEHSGATTAGH